MPIKVQCTGCKSAFSLKDDLAGKKVRCPKCKTPISVPAAGAAGVPSATATAPAAKPGNTTRRNAPQRVASPPSRAKRSSTKASVSDATVSMKLQGITCPECGTTIPQGELACPKCRYHLKLKRKIGISSAIHSANMHSQGLNRDGSKKVTRADVTEDRVEKERRVGKGLVLGVLALMLLVAVFSVHLVVKNYSNYSIEQLREKVKPEPLVAENPSTYDPLWISMGDEKITVNVPVDKILTVKPQYPSDWPQGSKGIASFAQTVMPPLAPPKAPFEKLAAVPIVERANQLGGSYTPKDLSLGAVGGDVVVWRNSAEPAEQGYLRGAILDFLQNPTAQGEITAANNEAKRLLAIREAKIKKAMRQDYSLGLNTPREKFEEKYPMPAVPQVEITGKLNFIPFYDYDMNGTIGSYRFSAENGSPNVRNKDNVRSRDNKDRPRINLCYFAPVIIVENARLIKTRR